MYKLLAFYLSMHAKKKKNMWFMSFQLKGEATYESVSQLMNCRFKEKAGRKFIF